VDRLLYIAMTGAQQSMALQDVHTNNLSNVDTAGFKSAYAQARAIHVSGQGWQSRAYALTESPATNFTQGSLDHTGRELDLAINGEGMFVVLDDSGEEAFTRMGVMTIDQNGFVRTAAGQIVMGNAGPLVLPEYEKLEIGADGTITVRALGQGPEALVEVDRMKLVNPGEDQLVRGPDGLFRKANGEVFEPPDFNVRVVSGALEESNVSAVNAMLEIMSSARQFEMQVKLMSKAEEMDAASSRAMRVT